MDYRRLLIPALVGFTGLIAAAVFWVAVQSSVRFALWGTVAEWELTAGEERRLAKCKAPGWWAWLKVMSADRDVPCGDVWAVTELSDKVRGPDREAWLQEWVGSSQASPLLRLRSALVLNAAGRVAPAEAAWLSQHPDIAGEDWAAPVAEEAAWGVHLGPRWMLPGMFLALNTSGAELSSVMMPLEAIGVLENPELKELAVLQVARAMGVDHDLPQQIRARRSRGLPSGQLPDGWLETVLRNPPCEAPCLELWTELLRVDIAAERGEWPNDAPPAPAMEPLASLLGFTGRRAVGLEWWSRAGTRWVAAAPIPAQRLASLGLGVSDGRATPVAALWNRSATPWMTLSVLVELARRAGLPTVASATEGGALEVLIGNEGMSGQVCGGKARSESSTWSTVSLPTIHAGALLEAAHQSKEEGDESTALRLLRAAQHLDPVLAAPLAGQWEAMVPARGGFALGQQLEREPGEDAVGAAVRSGLGALLTKPCSGS